MTAGQWDDDTRQAALDVYQREGLAAAAQQTGVPKSSLRRWAQDAGLDTNELAGENAERTRAAKDELTRRTTEARNALVPKLAAAAHSALDVEMEILNATKEIQRLAVAAQKGEIEEVPKDVMRRLEYATSGITIHEAVGARTRAIHDLQLLMGEATEQNDQGVTVVLAAPRPERQRAEEDVVDLGQVEGRVIPGEPDNQVEE